ncbi:(deoxy)nucleoside triphosphate pyrophosphohydrolase [Salinicoccus sp. Marseille-QA3877]
MTDKKYIRVVGAVILNSDDEILCAQRPEGKNLALKWEFPGGKVEEDETETEALVRELDEEMECQIDVLDKITTTVYEYDFGIVELTTYYAKILSGDIKLLEHVDMKWMSRENIGVLDWAPADIPAIELIQNYKGAINK